MGEEAGGPTSSPATPAPAAPRGANQRSPRNYLLEPLVQVRLGIYCIVLGLLSAAGTLGVLYAGLTRAQTQILALTTDDDAVTAIIAARFNEMAIYLGLIGATFIVATTVVSILYTHRLVGPSFAFRRHLKSLREGRYEVRTVLRKNDAFTEVAEDLNALSEHLQATVGKKG